MGQIDFSRTIFIPFHYPQILRKRNIPMELRYLISPVLVILLILLTVSIGSAVLPDQSLEPAENESSLMNSNSSSVTELVGFVNEAGVYAQKNGKEAAIQEFGSQNGSFIQGDRYIWAYNFDGINLAHPWHPEYQGQNKLSLTDDAGVRMIEEMRNMALNGTGFVTYHYDNPKTGFIEPKLAYVKKIDESWWIGSGIYGEGFIVPPDTPERVRDNLRTRVNDAVTYAKQVGKEQALETFNDRAGPFTTNGSYIFAFDMNGTTLALPFLPEKIGTYEGNLTDTNGVSIGGEKLMVAADGGGFWYYVFDNPDAGRKPELKISYIQPVDDTWVIGSGMYLSNVPVEFSSDRREKLVTQVNSAVQYVSEVGRDESLLEFNRKNGSFSDPTQFIFEFDKNGTLLANPYLPGLVGVNRLKDQDPYGKYPVRQLIANAENGGGFSYYFFADPDSDYAIRLKLSYTEMADDGLIIGAGIFPDTREDVS